MSGTNSLNVPKNMYVFCHFEHNNIHALFNIMCTSVMQHILEKQNKNKKQNKKEIHRKE